MKTQWILTLFKHFLLSQKNLIEQTHFTFVTRLQRNERDALFLFLVCGRFNIFFVHNHLHPFINRKVRTQSIVLIQCSHLIKTYCKTHAALTILTKPIVRLRRRCSCDFGRTSPAPLLEISETSVISS